MNLNLQGKKTKVCIHCQSEIPANAMTCAYCNKQPDAIWTCLPILGGCGCGLLLLLMFSLSGCAGAAAIYYFFY